MIKTIFWIIVTILLGYGLLVLLVYTFQHHLVYHPGKRVHLDPTVLNLDYETVSFTTNDNVQLSGWYIPGENSNGTILFCHGNAGDIADRMNTIQFIHQLGLNLLIFDYRGFGNSEGRPSEQGTYRDAMAAWKFLIDEKQTSPESIIVMGRSLGGAIAAWLATKVSPAAIILESTFTSAPDVATDIYPYLPARLMIAYKYPTEKYLKDLDIPKFIAHSKDDRLIPFEHGRRLYQAAAEPKEFFKMEGDHNSAFMDSGENYDKRVKQFIFDVLERSPTPSENQ